MLKSIFVVLHVITAAAWFGLGLRLAGQARKVAELGGETSIAMAADGRTSVWQMTLFIILTFLFSLGAFIAGGHFEAYGPIYHTSLTLILLLVADQLFVIRPGWNALQAAVTTPDGTSADVEAAESARKRIAIGTGVGHLLWLILLVLMFWNQYFAAAL